MRTVKKIASCVMTVALCVAACANEPLDLTADRDSFVFLAQQVAPTVVMDALFVGRVVRDGQGCLRLDSPAGPTVVWPFGSRLVLDGTDLDVRNAAGRRIGRLGGHFRLGGGEIDSLHSGLALSEADRQLGTSRCPGRYWIVGTVPA